MELKVLKGLNLSVSEGEYVAFMGPSGSGKSTLMNILGCLDSLTSGTYILDGQDVSTIKGDALAEVRNKKIGFVFQTFNLFPHLSVRNNIVRTLKLVKNMNTEKAESLAKEMLSLVGLSDKINNYPNELSGGQKQRVAIARAMINKPKLILADEPTGNLDEDTGELIFSLFRKINKEHNQSIVVVTHARDLSQVTDRQIYLKRGVLE